MGCKLIGQLPAAAPTAAMWPCKRARRHQVRPPCHTQLGSQSRHVAVRIMWMAASNRLLSGSCRALHQPGNTSTSRGGQLTQCRPAHNTSSIPWGVLLGEHASPWLKAGADHDVREQARPGDKRSWAVHRSVNKSVKWCSPLRALITPQQIAGTAAASQSTLLTSR